VYNPILALITHLSNEYISVYRLLYQTYKINPELEEIVPNMNQNTRAVRIIGNEMEMSSVVERLLKIGTYDISGR
jgi:hypothetical protein